MKSLEVESRLGASCSEVLPLYHQCWPFRIARVLSGFSPRGKGAIPRFIGKMTRFWIHHAFITRHGALIPLAADALDVFVAMSRQDNSYDYWVFRAANAMLEAGGVFYDVGANVGYMSVEMAHLRACDDVHVYAFEPNPQLADQIEKAVAMNGFDNVHVSRAAVGVTCGYLGFSENANSFIGSVAPQGVRASYRVDAVAVDELVTNKGFRPPDVVKIDVEGFEYAVLTGAREVLSEYLPAVIFEISPASLKYGYTPKLLVDYLGEAGDYQFYTTKCVPLKKREIVDKMGAHADILAIPSRRQARFDWYAGELLAGTIDSFWSR